MKRGKWKVIEAFVVKTGLFHCWLLLKMEVTYVFEQKGHRSLETFLLFSSKWNLKESQSFRNISWQFCSFRQFCRCHFVIWFNNFLIILNIHRFTLFSYDLFWFLEWIPFHSKRTSVSGNYLAPVFVFRFQLWNSLFVVRSCKRGLNPILLQGHYLKP